MINDNENLDLQHIPSNHISMLSYHLIPVSFQYCCPNQVRMIAYFSWKNRKLQLTQSKTALSKLFIQTKSVNRDIVQGSLLYLLANSSKNFIKPVKNPWKCKKSILVNVERKPAKIIFRFHQNKVDKNHFLEPMLT